MAIGSAGYMLFDIAVLGVCFPAFGNPLPPVDALLLAYIIGQLGGLIPLPGGIGGLDLGLLAALLLYGINATDAAEKSTRTLSLIFGLVMSASGVSSRSEASERVV